MFPRKITDAYTCMLEVKADPHLHILNVADLVSQKSRLTKDAILYGKRNEELTYYRWGIHEILRSHFSLKFQDIADYVSNGSHSRVINGLKIYESRAQLLAVSLEIDEHLRRKQVSQSKLILSQLFSHPLYRALDYHLS